MGFQGCLRLESLSAGLEIPDALMIKFQRTYKVKFRTGSMKFLVNQNKVLIRKRSESQKLDQENTTFKAASL